MAKNEDNKLVEVLFQGMTLNILKKCLFYNHTPLFKNKPVCSPYNTSHRCCHRCVPDSAQDITWLWRKPAEFICILGSKESLTFVCECLSKSESRLERVNEPGTRCFLSTVQSNLSTHQVISSVFSTSQLRRDLSLPFTLCSSGSHDNRRAPGRAGQAPGSHSWHALCCQIMSSAGGWG